MASKPLMMKKTAWDPTLNPDQRTPTKRSLKRIKKDIRALCREPLPGVCVWLAEHDIRMIHALITGPFGTPYERTRRWSSR